MREGEGEGSLMGGGSVCVCVCVCVCVLAERETGEGGRRGRWYGVLEMVSWAVGQSGYPRKGIKGKIHDKLFFFFLLYSILSVRSMTPPSRACVFRFSNNESPLLDTRVPCVSE